jgi:hypothetical protein
MLGVYAESSLLCWSIRLHSGVLDGHQRDTIAGITLMAKRFADVTMIAEQHR